MTTLHTFGCSITQGFALPDLVNTLTDSQGRVLTPQELADVSWEHIHIYAASQYAWPRVLGNTLGYTVENHARRGACFSQIARQCAVAADQIQPGDTCIVMWTYLSRLSLQWPSRTTVPFCNVVDPDSGWQTVILGFNKFFGLSGSTATATEEDTQIQEFIHDSVVHTYCDPLGVYDRYYNHLVTQILVDGLLRAQGARVIHLSVETEPYLQQLEAARQNLAASLREPYAIPDPADWYRLSVDHDSCRVIHDPAIPPAENDMHPSVLHHKNFAHAIYDRYFSLAAPVTG